MNVVRQKVKKLEKYRNSPFPILSFYIPLPKRKPSQIEKCFLVLKQDLGRAGRKFFNADVKKMETYVKNTESDRRETIAFFSSRKNLWEVVHFNLDCEMFCVIGYSPYLAPIKDALMV